MYRHHPKKQKSFISDRLNWPIHDICNDLGVAAETESKWRCTMALEGADLPTIPTSTIVNPSDTSYDETRVVQSAQDLQKFLNSAELPLFAKPNELLGSFGAIRIDSCEGDTVVLNGEPMTVETLYTDLMAGVCYIVQPLVRSHPTIEAFTDGLATIRTMNFREKSNIRVSHALYKFASAGNVADNFWREGNLLASINIETGTIDTVVSGSGPSQVSHATHPTLGTLSLIHI